jgi:hypothetical protein
VHYYTKVLGQPISEAEAYRRATPAQRATWWPTGAPVKADAAPAGVNLVTGASLDAAIAAGQRALREGYGSVLPDGQAPCGTCASCTYGHPEGCRRPVSKAMATLRRQQDNEPAQVALRQLAAAEGALLAHGL